MKDKSVNSMKIITKQPIRWFFIVGALDIVRFIAMISYMNTMGGYDML